VKIADWQSSAARELDNCGIGDKRRRPRLKERHLADSVLEGFSHRGDRALQVELA